MPQDFLGSVAQEDVSFITEIVKTSTPGQNYYKLMIFIEGNVDIDNKVIDGRFIEDPTFWSPAKTGSPINIATVTGDTYSLATKGLLRSWLMGFFANGTTADVYLVVFTPDIADPNDLSVAIPDLDAAYNLLKAYAYHKTILAGSDTELTPGLAVSLALKCYEDKKLLSAAPYYPVTTTDPINWIDDPIIAALFAEDPTFKWSDAFVTAYQDPSVNGALYSLGLAMSRVNGSGTPIGNNMDYWGTTNIGCSGPNGENLDLPVRIQLKDHNIQFFKPVGDDSGMVDAIGVRTLGGEIMQALWIVNYIQYMGKVNVARYISRPNRLRNNSSYQDIIAIMKAQIDLFAEGKGTGRLREILITPPPFASLPPSKGDEIVIPDAWSATYTDQIHSVKVYGTLYIAA